jgi:hypothetical protein
MDTPDSVEAYRARLLSSLHVVPAGDHDEELGSLQIFVNHECVGIMECDQAGHAVASITQARAIQTVEIRTASGRLIGSLCAQDLRMKMARLPVGDHVIEISIHNRVDGGSVQVAYHAAKLQSEQGRRMVSDERAKASLAWLLPSRPWFPQSVWSHLAVAGRAGVAIAVLFLVVDRLAERAGSPSHSEQIEVRATSISHDPAVSEKALARYRSRSLTKMRGRRWICVRKLSAVPNRPR